MSPFYWHVTRVISVINDPPCVSSEELLTVGWSCISSLVIDIFISSERVTCPGDHVHVAGFFVELQGHHAQISAKVQGLT
jgi:hypothetical protein